MVIRDSWALAHCMLVNQSEKCLKKIIINEGSIRYIPSCPFFSVANYYPQYDFDSRFLFPFCCCFCCWRGNSPLTTIGKLCSQSPMKEKIEPNLNKCFPCLHIYLFFCSFICLKIRTWA